MIYWGINSFNHGSSLAVIDSESKHDLPFFKTSTEDRLPRELITNALHIGTPKRIFWYERPLVKKIRQLYAGQYSSAADFSDMPATFINQEGFSWVPVSYTPHHASHAAAGYYTSPFDQCAVVVIDAIGEFECATIWEGKNNKLRKVWSRNYPNSLGLFYSAFTKLIGLEPLKQEYLLQEMAEHGDPTRYYSTVKEYVNNIVCLTRNLHKGVYDWPHVIVPAEDHNDIAAAVQLVFEEQIELIMDKARELTGSNCLVYMGGCAMNSKANAAVVKKWDYVWSLANPGDPSSSIGAVLYHTKHRLHQKLDPVKHIEIRI